MKSDMTVYTAACWWRECDPHTSVIALSAKQAKHAIFDAMKESASSAAHSTDDPCSHCNRGRRGDHVSCGLDAQAWSGVFPGSLRAILRDTRTQYDGGERGRYQRREIIDSLRADGVAYPEVP